MMGVKELVHDARGYVLMGDERDIAVSKNNRQEVYEWAGENGITVEIQGSMSGTDVWRVKDEKHRMWFLLRWA